LEQKIFIRKTEEEVVRGLKKEPIAYRTYFGWNEELRERFLSFCFTKVRLIEAESDEPEPVIT